MVDQPIRSDPGQLNSEANEDQTVSTADYSLTIWWASCRHGSPLMPGGIIAGGGGKSGFADVHGG
jgi:hypothetical protein